MANALRHRPVGTSLLAQLLETPDLAPRLQALPPPALRQLLLEIGLEDAGELIALASFEQLRDVFDEDLWRSRTVGADAEFDAERFALWLEMLVEAGDAFVADRLAAFSEDFLAFAFSSLFRVVDVARAADAISDPDEADLLDKVVDGAGSQELDGYLIVARRESGWDAVWSTLLALDARQPELLRALLQRAWLATESAAENAGGLYTLLSEGDALREDASAERDDRRAARGYVSPADARAFLALARHEPATPEIDPITHAYFRELAPPEAGAPWGSRAPAARVDRLAEWALRSGETSAALEPAAREDESALFRAALAELAERDPRAHQRSLEELAYLANVLVAGDGSRGRPWRPVEAAGQVLALCEAGLSKALGAAPGTGPASTLARWGAVGLFRIAWAATGAERATRSHSTDRGAESHRPGSAPGEGRRS